MRLFGYYKTIVLRYYLVDLGGFNITVKIHDSSISDPSLCFIGGKSPLTGPLPLKMANFDAILLKYLDIAG